jgi:hypothetical protein
MMPHKFNASRRHKFEKKRQKVTNWRVYNEGLRQRGDVTIWLSPEVEDKWLADKRQTPGGQPTYSDMAISICLRMGIVFKQPLRQTQGLVGSLARLMGLDVPVPDFSTLSRRGVAQIGRWKMVIGPKLKARNFPNQKTEVRIGTNILNKMNGLGRAKYEAVA